MHRRSAYRFIAVIMGLGFSDLPASASIAVVPDEYPSIQKAIDAGVDTVQIREGQYAERPLVERPLVIQGIGLAERPRLDGLEITNGILVSGQRFYGFSGCNLLGPVNITIVNVHPRNLEIEFSECALDSGIRQLVSLDTDDIARLTIRNSRLSTTSHARVWRVEMSADTISGGVAWDNRDNAIENCWFTGGPGTALYTTATGGSVKRNRIENYQTGIHSILGDEHAVEDNVISGCRDGIDVGGTSYVTVRGNTITNGVNGVSVVGSDNMQVVDNKILDMQGYGIYMGGVDFSEASSNVVGRCSLSGIVMNAPGLEASIAGNTLFGNGGSGIAVTGSGDPIRVQNNIAYRNGAWGLDVASGLIAHLGCNDWFENNSGAVHGVAVDSTDLAVDPQFCSADSADVRLNVLSPLIDAAGCGRVGALGKGCALTPTLLRRFSVEESDGAALIRWQLGFLDPTESWLERAGEVRGPWRRLSGTPVAAGEAFEQTDKDVVPCYTYWYRVCWRSGTESIDSAPVSFVLEKRALVSRVIPNPSRGPVRIEWAMESAGPADVRVHDLAGRRIARPIHGWLDAGSHSAEWDGRLPNGSQAPAGWYVARLRTGSLTATRMILLVR